MGLPSGYRRLTYIVGNGNQYIDTGLTVQKSDSWRYILEADLVSSDNYAGCNGYLQYQAKIGNGVKSEIDIVYKDITETITVNGTQVSSQNWSSYSGTNVKIGILKLGETNNGWYNGAAQSGKIYFCKIYKSDVLVRDFVPCINTSGEVGLYDLVDKQFYGNAGTGTFTAGPSSLNLPVNIGGTWKDANEAFVNIGGTWKTVKAVSVNINGTWKELS